MKMKEIKKFGVVVVFAAAICSIVYYFANLPKQQPSTTMDSTTVQCDSVCLLDSTSKACCDSVKVDSVSK
jgi:hypothetical protein